MNFNYKNKEKNIREQVDYLFSKTNSMFNWFGLPETIPSNELEKILQKNGVAFIYEYGGEIYAFSGSMSGELDVYGNFKQFSITNPALNLVKIVDIKDGVLISNDAFQMGLKPLFSRYSTMLVENDITMVVNGYNTRIQKVISASDDKTILSAEKYIEKIVGGEIGIIGESALFEGVKTQSTASGQNPITSLVEYQQYLKASLYNEIGINANFNMKRDRLASSEVDVMADAIFPFVDNMLTCRQKSCEEMFEKFGFEVSVEYGSIWKDKRIEVSTGQNPNGDGSGDPEPPEDAQGDPEALDVEARIQIEIEDQRKEIENKIREFENNSGDPAEIEELKILLKDLEEYGDGK